MFNNKKFLIMRKFYFYRLSASSDPKNYRYIGTTVNTVEARLSGHKYCAMHSNKRGLPVHKWMWKHYQLGETILTEQIFECDEAEWEYHEKRLIKEYRKAGYDLLNLDEGGKGVITKEKRSVSSIERSIQAHEVPIYAIDPNTMEIWQEFPSSVKAAEYFMFKSHSSIGNALNGRTKKSAGYYWVYKSDWDAGINKINTEPNFQKLKHSIYRFDFNGNLICKYESGRDLEKTSGITNSKAAKNAIKSKKWYLDSFWSDSENINIEEYHDLYYLFEEVDSKGNVIEKFHTQSEIADKYKLNQSTIYAKIKENKPLSNGNYLRKIIKNKI